MKVAVVIATYWRKDDRSKDILKKMFACLKSQTYKDFKVFIVGDDYIYKDQFFKICEEYKSEKSPIYYSNNNFSCRKNIFTKRINQWTCGGIFARHKALSQAIKEKYDIYLHLDDDDIWLPTHIENYCKIFKKFPTAAFIYSKAIYKKGVLPKNIPENIKISLNNLSSEIKPGNIVHSSFGFRLSKTKNILMSLFNDRMTIIKKIKNKEIKEIKLKPFDAVQLRTLRNKNIPSVFIPKITCTKLTDCNIPK